MKRILFILAALAILTSVSCTREQNTIGNEVTVSFVAETPGSVATKAYSDGFTANRLYYAVYAEDKTTVITQGEKDFEKNSLKTTVDITLVIGKTYDIIFWAQNPSAPYTFDMGTQTVTADYESGVSANDETLDAFYYTEDSYKVSGQDPMKPVYLKRPFAQINVVTNDEDIAGQSFITVQQSSMTISGIRNKLNLKDGSVSGTPADVTFKLADIPEGENDKFTIGTTEYGYMQMNYVLVPADRSLTDIRFTLQTNEHPIEYSLTNVDVQRNHKTNIYGALLTDPTTWAVEIIPDYDLPDYGQEIQ